MRISKSKSSTQSDNWCRLCAAYVQLLCARLCAAYVRSFQHSCPSCRSASPASRTASPAEYLYTYTIATRSCSRLLATSYQAQGGLWPVSSQPLCTLIKILCLIPSAPYLSHHCSIGLTTLDGKSSSEQLVSCRTYHI